MLVYNSMLFSYIFKCRFVTFFFSVFDARNFFARYHRDFSQIFFFHCLFDFGCRGCICYMVEILPVSLYTYQDELEAYTSLVYCFPEVCFDIIIR